MPNTTWNPSDKSANLTLSGSNLTATGTAGNSTGVRSVASESTGKYYFEYTCTTWTANYVIVGVGNASAILVGAASTPTNISGVYGYNGSIWTNNVNTGSTLGTRADGDIIGCALDMTNALIWFRAAPSGNWNGSGTANPGTGVGGLSISAIGSPLFAYAGSSSPAEVVTANFGDSAFTGAVPSGFTAGLPATLTTANLTQIAAEHWLSAQARAQLTQVAVEQWASASGVANQAIMTQVALEQWASVAAASTAQARAMILA